MRPMAMPSTPTIRKATVSLLAARRIIAPYGGGSGGERKRAVLAERERDYVRRLLLLDHDAVLLGPRTHAAAQAGHRDGAGRHRGPDRDGAVGEHGGEHD